MRLEREGNVAFDPDPESFCPSQFTSRDGRWVHRLTCNCCGGSAVTLLGAPTVELAGAGGRLFIRLRVYFECSAGCIFTLSFLCGPSEVWLGSHWAGAGIPAEIEALEKCSGR